jgi:hypothetical protein
MNLLSMIYILTTLAAKSAFVLTVTFKIICVLTSVKWRCMATARNVHGGWGGYDLRAGGGD